MKSVNLVDIYYFLKNKPYVNGNQWHPIYSPATLTNAESDQISFCVYKDEKAIKLINESKAGLVICHNDLRNADLGQKNRALVFVSNPRLAFIKVVRKFFSDLECRFTPDHLGLKHSSLIIHRSAVIGRNVNIGDQTVIEPNVTIYPNTIIGQNCLIKAGAVIGGSGFGFEQDEKGKWYRFPQLGRVIIKNNVYIGSCTCIDRGSLGNTVIEDGVKIDNLCHIAHNIRFEENVMVIALSEISGGVKIGKGTYIAPQVTVIDNVTIGSNCLVGIGSLVLKDLPDNVKAFGRPVKIKEETK